MPFVLPRHCPLLVLQRRLMLVLMHFVLAIEGPRASLRRRISLLCTLLHSQQLCIERSICRHAALCQGRGLPCDWGSMPCEGGVEPWLLLLLLLQQWFGAGRWCVGSTTEALCRPQHAASEAKELPVAAVL